MQRVDFLVTIRYEEACTGKCSTAFCKKADNPGCPSRCKTYRLFEKRKWPRIQNRYSCEWKDYGSQLSRDLHQSNDNDDRMETSTTLQPVYTAYRGDVACWAAWMDSPYSPDQKSTDRRTGFFEKIMSQPACIEEMRSTWQAATMNVNTHDTRDINRQQILSAVNASCVQRVWQQQLPESCAQCQPSHTTYANIVAAGEHGSQSSDRSSAVTSPLMENAELSPWSHKIVSEFDVKPRHSKNPHSVETAIRNTEQFKQFLRALGVSQPNAALRELWILGSTGKHLDAFKESNNHRRRRAGSLDTEKSRRRQKSIDLGGDGCSRCNKSGASEQIWSSFEQIATGSDLCPHASAPRLQKRISCECPFSTPATLSITPTSSLSSLSSPAAVRMVSRSSQTDIPTMKTSKSRKRYKRHSHGESTATTPHADSNHQKQTYSPESKPTPSSSFSEQTETSSKTADGRRRGKGKLHWSNQTTQTFSEKTTIDGIELSPCSSTRSPLLFDQPKELKISPNDIASECQESDYKHLAAMVECPHFGQSSENRLSSNKNQPAEKSSLNEGGSKSSISLQHSSITSETLPTSWYLPSSDQNTADIGMKVNGSRVLADYENRRSTEPVITSTLSSQVEDFHRECSHNSEASCCIQ